MPAPSKHTYRMENWFQVWVIWAFVVFVLMYSIVISKTNVKFERTEENAFTVQMVMDAGHGHCFNMSTGSSSYEDS